MFCSHHFYSLCALSYLINRLRHRARHGVLNCSDPCITFLLLYITCVSAPVGGFFLESCHLSHNAAICSDRHLKLVPKDIPPTVISFDLSKNQISRIQAGTFTNLLVLKDLNLHQNQILKIDNGSFSNLISLQKLTLNNNRLVKLGQGTFDGLSNLLELRLNTNNIAAVSSTAFQSLIRLKLLDISQNHLGTMKNLYMMLQHMPQLQQFTVRRNKLKHFYSWEFTNHSLDLQVLDLSNNPIRDFRITNNIFPNLTCLSIGDPFSVIKMEWDVKNKTFLRQVSSIDISGLHTTLQVMEELLETVNTSLTSLAANGIKHNRTKLINLACSIPTLSQFQFRRGNLRIITSDFLKPCVHVTELDLSENHIKTINENAFKSMEKLTVLRLSQNKLSVVPSAIQTLQNLSELDLSNNLIGTVNCHDFSNQTKLKELNLKNNSITLKDCVFKDLVRLQVLRLQSNQITDLKGAFKSSLSNLKRLHLNGNKLKAIRNGEFNGLKSLLNLSLHQNQIETLDKYSFVGLIKLTDIQLQSNALKKITFNLLANLRRLDLSDNRIQYPENATLTELPFSNLSCLEELSINAQHHRGKSTLPSNFLQGLKNLLRFSARNCQLIYLDKDTFTYTPKLERLDISSNDLQTLSPEHFAPIRNLKSLYISRIALQSLDFLRDAKLTKLKFLQGRHNQYSVITEDVIKSLPSLMYLDLKYISFYCACDNAWFINWTRNSKQTLVNGAYNYSCNYPDNFKGKKLLDLDLKPCLYDVNFISFVSTSCIVCFVMVGSFAYHLMRLQLYCAYYLLLSWLFDSKYKNNQAPHQYDAFISYNYHDEPWVMGELLPKLEGEQGWRLCLHHRDFQPGRSILDNITDAIYGSRKTICVISRRYLESEWCSTEIQAASYRLFDQKKDVLILVFLEDIPTYMLSPFHRMRKLLKRQTYLSWPRAAGQPGVFWEKLRKALQTGNDPSEENVLLTLTGT
uniref:Toll-like receptor 13 n=1 Tax=Cyprinodon variegatus TaxID=28743 RepID=A0A3Q2CTJ7_CYPVA